MRSLELFRLAGNQFSEIPPVLSTIPKLSWTSLANNPLSSDNVLKVDLPKVKLDNHELIVGYDSINFFFLSFSPSLSLSLSFSFIFVMKTNDDKLPKHCKLSIFYITCWAAWTLFFF